MRRHVPESPRWLFIHGRDEEAETIVRSIEKDGRARRPVARLPEIEDEPITIRQRRAISIAEIARTVFTLYPRRTILCFSLFVGQAFLYNAFFFTYGDSLTTFFDVKQTGYYLAVFAAEQLRRRPAAQPAVRHGRPGADDHRHLHPVRGCCWRAPAWCSAGSTATTLTIFGCVIFFFASAGASAAYLTASEVFPLETRALCIAFFYAIGTAVGGISGPLLFGRLIDSASESKDITGWRSATSSAPR